jgi:hypothetical protein
LSFFANAQKVGIRDGIIDQFEGVDAVFIKLSNDEFFHLGSDCGLEMGCLAFDSWDVFVGVGCDASREGGDYQEADKESSHSHLN